MRTLLRHGLAMLSISGHSSYPYLKVGEWLSAKIYNDSKKGCSCGSNEWKYLTIRGLEDYEHPVCARCGKDPELYVIVATVIDEHGSKKRIKIRHTQSKRRLKKYIDVTYTLQEVINEIESNTFDVRRYESEESRDSFIFSNVVESYLLFHEARLSFGKLSPGGFKDKKTIIKNHLMPYFKEMDISFITTRTIKDFFNKSSATERMRDRATAELKTILRHAVEEMGILTFVPKFPKLSASRMVDSEKFLTADQQEKVLSSIDNPVYQAAIRFLAIYALRPCEARSLKWNDIDLLKGVIYIRSHISVNKEIPGRKSVTGKAHELPIVDEFLDAISVIPRSINENDYVFKGRKGGAIGDNVLRLAWNDACKLVRIKGVTLYQGTKHSTLSNLGKAASDSQLIKLTGHTNTKVIRRYNQSNISDIRDLLNNKRTKGG